MPANESFHLQRLWGLIREQEFYICHSPAFSGITQSFCCVSKRRSICGIPVFGNKIDLYQFLYRLLGQGSNFNYTDMYRKQCPSLVLKDAPVTNGNILPYSSLRNLSPACGQRQSFGQVSKKDIWRIGSHCVQRHLHIALGESGSWAGFEHWEGNNPLHKENFHWRASKIVKQTNIWCFPKSGTATPPLKRCATLEQQTKITWGPILPGMSLSALTDGSTENQQNKEEIEPTLWKSKSHLSSVITVLPSSLQSRTRVSLSYTSTAK